LRTPRAIFVEAAHTRFAPLHPIRHTSAIFAVLARAQAAARGRGLVAELTDLDRGVSSAVRIAAKARAVSLPLRRWTLAKLVGRRLSRVIDVARDDEHAFDRSRRQLFTGVELLDGVAFSAWARSLDGNANRPNSHHAFRDRPVRRNRDLAYE
jgi:hypothetical protein